MTGLKTMASRRDRMEAALRTALAPVWMALEDESARHGAGGMETHFNLVIVADAFSGKSSVQRHRAVYGALAGELEGGLHALTLKVLTLAEWQAAGGEALTNPSPSCRGGSKG